MSGAANVPRQTRQICRHGEGERFSPHGSSERPATRGPQGRYIVGGLLTVIALLLIACGSAPATATPILTSPSSTAQPVPATSAPTPSGAQAQSTALPVARPFTRPVATDFVNPVQGWVVAGECNAFGEVRCGIITTSDGGNTWTKQDEGKLALAEVTFIDTSIGWAVGNSGPGCATLGGDCASAILGTADGGRTWRQVGTSEKRLSGLQFVDPQNGWALAQNCVGSGSNARCQQELQSSTE